MNAPVTHTALLPAEMPAMTDTAALILQGDAMDRIERFANKMAKGTVSVPRHFVGKEGDCFAVCLQAMQWRMNPFAVAQKTFISPSGALGYEGTLVAAALSTSGALEGDLRYEYIGDWSKVRGKWEKRESKNSGGEKFYIVGTYSKSDEAGLGVRAIGRLRGEKQDRVVELYMDQCYPRFSTQWANNPEQQIVYAVDRVWARRHKPSVMLGVYTEDEVNEPGVKFMGPADVVGAPPPPPAAPAPAAVKTWSDEEFLTAARDAKIKEFYSKGKAADEIIAFYGQKAALTDAQMDHVRKLKPAAAKPADVQDATVKVTYAALLDKFKAATTADALDEAATLIAALPADQQAEATTHYETRRAELA